MNLVKGAIYKTCMKSYLMFDYKTDLLYHFILVTKKGEPIEQRRNKIGMITLMVKRSYTEETVESFKLVKRKENEKK